MENERNGKGLCTDQELDVEIKSEPLAVVSGITFAQVPYWFPHYCYRDLKMDMILSFGHSEKRKPLFVWICGGAWLTSERAAHLPFLMQIARRGYVVASVDYRKVNSAHFPAQLEDVKSAIRYLRAHAEEFGIDTERIAVGGESAGAYLAAMAGVTGRQRNFDKGAYLEQSSAVAAVVDFYGPSYFSEKERGGLSPEDMFLGECGPEKRREAGVIPWVDASAPPFLIAHGMADPIVPIAHSEALYGALREACGRAQFFRLRDAVHADGRFYQDEMARRVADFLDDAMADSK